MAGIDPLSLGLANEALLAAETAFIEAALDLGVSSDVLQAQLTVGDLVSATVLPAQNGHDVIEIFDRPVVAQLPPDVRPGETLLLQVTGFAGNRIVVRNLGTVDPQNPPPTVRLELPQPATARQTPAQSPQNSQPVQAQPRTVPASPARELFVAAAVRQAAAMPQVQKAVQTVATVAQRVLRTAGDLLKVARVPDMPLTRTAAAIAPQASTRLPVVLQRLDAALPRETSDSRVATLRTLIAFTARMNPANEETLAAQISAYASHVLEGGEPKLQQLLQAHAAAPAPQPLEQAGAIQTPAPGAAPPDSIVRQSQPQPQPQPQPQLPAHAATIPPHLAQARVAERAAAVDHDLKSLVLSLLRDPQSARTPTLTQALNETLITLTGTQLNTLVSNAQDPGTISFALPVYFHESGKPAYLRISRDAESRGGTLNADNFHVAFVLDTAHLGTVAIDVESTGRAVNVNVKTEREAAASRFADTFASLRGRLEDLRYRVASITANALAAKPAATDAAIRRDAEGLDLRA